MPTITSVTYRELKTFHNYSNKAVEATALIAEGEENPSVVLEELTAWVRDKLGDEEQSVREQQARENARYELRRIVRAYGEARDRLVEANAILVANGLQGIDLDKLPVTLPTEADHDPHDRDLNDMPF